MQSIEPKLIEININGKKENISSDISLKGLLEQKKINSNIVACELNLKIIKRAQLDNTFFKPNDTLEIIQMIGGG